MQIRIGFILVVLCLFLTACDSNTGETTNTNEASNQNATGSINVQVSGASEGAISYVTYNKNTDSLGVYDIRFFIDDSESDSTIVNDIVFTLPNEITPGTYTLSGTTPLVNINELDNARALVTINLAPRAGLPFALGNPTTGELVITDTSNDSISGTFTLSIGDESEEMVTISGEMNALGKDILP